MKIENEKMKYFGEVQMCSLTLLGLCACVGLCLGGTAVLGCVELLKLC